MKVPVALLLLLLGVGESLSARILGINPTPMISHQQPFLSIMRALANNGHHVTVLTTDPLKNPPQNMTQIDMSFSYNRLRKEMDFVKLFRLPLISFMEAIWPVTARTCDDQLSSPQVKSFLESNEKFDAIVLEIFFYPCYFGIQHKMGYPPVIGFMPMTMFPYFHDIMGSLNNPSYIPDFGTSYTDHMTFWERLLNVYSTLASKYMFHVKLLPLHEEVLKKHFGPDAPNIYDAQYNLSMMFVANHFSTNYPRPYLPNVIEMTGLHVEETRPLPKDIKEFLDGAKDGAIYFSLGSNVRSENLPPNKRRALLEAFSELPQRVLWKFEADSLPGQPDNVMVAKWLPQQDVLAHPNIRLFITQGGLQSMNEASYHAVPFLGIPFFADQRVNVAKMMAAGIGEKLHLGDVTKESVKSTVQKIIGNPSYRENMRRFSAVFREHKAESLDKAVWWVEYVIRHKGARHLRSAALDLRWWQLLLLDVAAFLAVVTASALFLIYRIGRYVLRKIRKVEKRKKQ